MNHNQHLTPAFGYVLLWYGPKHTRARLDRRPGAREQLLMIGRYAKMNGLKVAGVESEYLRQASAPEDFAVLFWLLERTSAEEHAPVVILDDITRLMKRLPSDQIVEFVMDLSPWFGRVHDARLGSLNQVDDSYWGHLESLVKQQQLDLDVARRTRRHRGPVPPKQMRRAQKRAAQERTRQAEESARQIGALREELLAQIPDTRLTFAAIARVANERGLKTLRGSDWSSVQVSRALARLAKRAADQ